jgi:hypothetical protein
MPLGRISGYFVSGTDCYVYGDIYDQYGPYTGTVWFDIVAYDTLTTVVFNDKASGNNKPPIPVAPVTAITNIP